MDWTRAVDIYCERVSAAFWAEPINALTNIAFILAGLFALRMEAARNGRGIALTGLLAILFAVALIAILSQVIGTAWALSASDAPMALVILKAVASVGILALALTWAPAAFPDPGISWPAIWLSANAVVVGIGSFLFHTVAQSWAGAADGGPIMFFILGYFVVTMNRYGGLSWLWASIATAGFVAGMVAMSAGLRALRDLLPPGYEILLASSSYYPALVALLLVGAWLKIQRAHPAGGVLMRVGGLFAISLAFRSMDGPLCDWIPIGTHFLWHLFNGLIFWILLQTLVRHGALPVGARREAAA